MTNEVLIPTKRECKYHVVWVPKYRKKKLRTFWARGFYVSTVGFDEAMIQSYIKHQEKEDQRLDQFKLL